MVLSCSWIRATRFWRSANTERLPKSASFTSSETSSPTSKSGSIFWASESSISSLGSSTSPFSTTMRLRHISKSPLSGLIIISKLSSVPYFFFKVLRNTSSRIDINVTRSINFSSLNSENDSIRARFSILLVKLNLNGCFFNFVIGHFGILCYGVFSFTNGFWFTCFPLQCNLLIVWSS